MKDYSQVDKFYEWLEKEQAEIEANGPKKRRGRKPKSKK